MSCHDLILAGAGPSHLCVLRRWALGQRPPGRIALVNSEEQVWHRGRTTTLVAGRCHPDDARLALRPLCEAAGIELITGQVVALDAAQRRLQLADGRTLSGSLLALAVGNIPAVPPQQGDAMQLLPVRPFSQFFTAWQAWKDTPAPLAILGGGAHAVELALALAGQVPQISLFCAGSLLGRRADGLRLRTLGHLRQRGVRVRENCPIERVEDDGLYSASGLVWRGSRLIVAGRNQPWPWLAASGLAMTPAGLLSVDGSLRSSNQPAIFASGDCASVSGQRPNQYDNQLQGRILAENLAASLLGQPLHQHQPQPQKVTLLSTSDGNALLDWHGWSAEGRLCGWLRERQDRRFISRYTSLPARR
jgi:NADH dehydrogenase FAD-containing subunit